MTLGLPPAGTSWQPAGGSRSPSALPSPRRSFVPRSRSAHLGAVRVRGEEGKVQEVLPPPPAARPVPRPPLPAPPPHLPAGEGCTRAAATPPHSAPPGPPLPVPGGGGGAQKREPSSPRRARLPHPSWGRGHPSRVPRVSPSGLSSRGRRRCVWLGSCHRWRSGRPLLPLLDPREEKHPPPLRF